MHWSPIVDGHADTLTRLAVEERDLCSPSTRGHSDLDRLLAAGVSLQVLAICLEDREGGGDLRQVLELCEYCRNEIGRRAEAFLILNRADLDLIGPGRIGFLLGLEGAAPLKGRPELLEPLQAEGLRLLGLTWNHRNAFADGVGVADGAGLTGAGRDLVALAEDLGILLDLAHLGPRGFLEVIAMARRPVVVSHANAFALRPHPRNLTDDQLRSVAARGGLIGVTLYPPFLTEAPRAEIGDVLRHLEHLVRVAGADAVGFGLDYDGIEAAPADLPDITALPRLLAAMDRLGLAEEDRRGILGWNWLRILRQVLP